jgi:hypothetical protein
MADRRQSDLNHHIFEIQFTKNIPKEKQVETLLAIIEAITGEKNLEITGRTRGEDFSTIRVEPRKS